MPLSVDYNYKFALDLILKNQAGGLKSTAFENLWNDAQGSYQDDLLGRFQARSNGKTGINTGLIEDETILQKLSPFTTTVSLSIAAGIVSKPVDFVYRVGFRINGEDVYKITSGQIASVNNSVIDPPSITNNKYYFVEYENFYKLLPTTLPTVAITTADLDYISTPVNVVWAYIFDGDGRQIYDAANSVQPLWDNSSCREITKRMLTTLGVSFKDQDFANFGKSVQLTGE